MIDATARMSVYTVRGTTMSIIGRPVLTADMPQSPRTKSQSHTPYCSMTGLSRPAALLNSASCSGVASRPSTRMATLMPST